MHRYAENTPPSRRENEGGHSNIVNFNNNLVEEERVRLFSLWHDIESTENAAIKTAKIMSWRREMKAHFAKYDRHYLEPDT